MGLVAVVQAEWERAARLLAAAESLRAAAGLPPDTSSERADALAAAQRALGADAFAAAFAEGQAMDWGRACADALRGGP
jgi:hypothetical protein